MRGWDGGVRVCVWGRMNCFEYVEFKITVGQKMRKSRKESEQCLAQRYIFERHQIIETMRIKMKPSWESRE